MGATFPRVGENWSSLYGPIFWISCCKRSISRASLWSLIFNIRVAASETRFAARAPHRRDARRHAAALAPAQCRHGDARGLEVSPGGLLQNELVQRQIRDRLAQSAAEIWSRVPHFELVGRAAAPPPQWNSAQAQSVLWVTKMGNECDRPTR